MGTRWGPARKPKEIVKRVEAGPITVGFEADAGGVWLSWKPTNVTRDFIVDLKLIPGNHRSYNSDLKIWWVSHLYFPLVADFIKGHFGIDLTPERDHPTMPAIEFLGHADD